MNEPETLYFGSAAQTVLAGLQPVFPYEVFEQIVTGLAVTNSGASLVLVTHRGGVVTGTLTDTDGQQYKVTVEPI